MLVPIKKKMADYAELSSGAEIDLNDVDVYACKSIQDCLELDALLQRKVVDIEYQLDCYAACYHPDGELFTPERPPPHLWEQRAKKALGMTKVLKQELANLRSFYSNKRDKVKRETFATCFVDLCKLTLPADQFDMLKGKALQIAAATQPDEKA